MLLGFKDRFVPYVEEGSKTHTIRATRTNPPKVGQVCDCYAKPRQKGMRLLGRWLCVKVEDVTITQNPDRTSSNPVLVYIEGSLLTPDECDALAWRDGFRPAAHYSRERDFIEHRPSAKDPHGCFTDMMGFWNGRLPFYGHLIHWKYTEAGRTATKASSRALRRAA